jgi:two-component sensor histidine kinase
MLLASPPSSLPLRLIDEISHRVCNEDAEAIATLAMAEAASADPGARRTLRCAADRLCSQAQAHRVLRPPCTEGPIDVGEDIAIICRQLATSPAAGSALEVVHA